MKSYEQCLEEKIKELQTELDDCVDRHGNITKTCMDYLAIFQIYSAKIRDSETVVEARDWSNRMIDHALRVK